jgi:hypothetical protein
VFECFLFKVNQQFKYVNFKIIYNIFIFILSLVLGSWWALQEGSWGGWWNWDPSEVFGLIIFSYLLFSRHFFLNNLNIYFFTLNSFLYLLIVLILYFFLQLNFNLISHNFGINLTQSLFLLVNFFFFYIFIFVFFFFLIKYIDMYIILFLNSKSIRFIDSKFYLFLLIFLILNLYLLSFWILIEDFFYKFFQINFFNWFFINFNIIVYIYICLLILVFRVSNILYLFFFKKVMYSKTYLYFLVNLNYIYILHILLLLFLLESIFFKNFNILFFENIKFSNTNYNFFNLKSPLNLEFNLDTFYIFTLYNLSINSYMIELPLTFLTNSFINEIYSFLHVMNLDYIFQILWLGSVVNLNLIYIIDMGLTNLIFLFLSISLIYFCVFRNVQLIIF